MTELVSIIIPAYNAEKWIGETIKSAINQTWGNKEIIIVDDGSSDATFKIASGFESKNVKVISQRNKGASAARNTALTIAQGTYIQYLDADDLLAPDKISCQLQESIKGLDSLVLLSSAWGKFFSRPNRAQFRPSSLWQDLDPVEWIIRKFTENTFMADSSWLVSRRLIEIAGRWDERLSLDDDGEYACRVVSKCEKVKFVADAKCYYRVGSIGSQSFMTSDKALHSQFLSICLCIEHIKLVEDSERTRRACWNYLNDYYNFFYPDNVTLSKNVRDLAASLGGDLNVPVERHHSRLFKTLFGQKRARKIRHLYNRYKLVWLNILDKLGDDFNSMR